MELMETLSPAWSQRLVQERRGREQAALVTLEKACHKYMPHGREIQQPSCWPKYREVVFSLFALLVIPAIVIFPFVKPLCLAAAMYAGMVSGGLLSRLMDATWRQAAVLSVVGAIVVVILAGVARSS